MSTTPHTVSTHKRPVGRILLDDEVTSKLNAIARHDDVSPLGALMQLLGINATQGISLSRCGTDSLRLAMTGEALAQFEEQSRSQNRGQFIVDRIKNCNLKPMPERILSYA